MKEKKYLPTNERGNRIRSNLWDTAHAVLRGNFIAILETSLQNQDKSQINSLIPYLEN